MKFVGGRPLAAHNAEFDIGFIRENCRKEGLPFDPTYIDSLILAQNLLPELTHFKLDVVAERLKLPAFNHHRASDDGATVGYMLAPFLICSVRVGFPESRKSTRKCSNSARWARPTAGPGI